MGFLRDLLVRIKGDSSQLDSTLDKSGEKVGGFKTKIFALGTAITGAAVAAFAVWKRAMESTEETMDKLEATTQYFKGGFQGLMSTIATGDWGGLIDNIKKTASAYRDLARARDEMEHTEASNVLRKSYLEKSLQEARLGYAESTNPGTKAAYLEQAISSQKAITEIEVSEVRARITAFEQQYKTLAGLDDESSTLLITNLRKIAGNYEAFYGPNGQYALLLEQKKNIDYKKQLGPLNATDRQILSAVANLQIFDELQKNLEPGVFMEYVKSLGEFNNTIAAGDQALFRLTKTLTTVQGKLEDIKRVASPAMAAVGNIAIPQLTGNITTPNELRPGPTDAGYDAALVRLKQFQKDMEGVMNELQYMVQDFAAQFLDAIGQALAGGNTKDLGKGLLIALANFMVQFGVMLLTTGLGLKAFAESMNNPENAGIAIAAGAALIIAGGAIKGLLSKGAKGGGGSSGGGGYSAAAMEKAMKIEVYGKIEGKDIAITSRRYVEDNG
jgi:hypothetical protein